MKEEYFNKQCEKIEKLERKLEEHDAFNMYKEVKRATDMHNNRDSNMLVDEQGQMLTSIEEKLTEWTRYIERRVMHDIVASDDFDITRVELEKAFSSTKNGKAPGPDKIHIEVIKILNKDRVIVYLLSLFNSIYKTGIIPYDWLKSTFVALSKKLNAKRCKDYRIIISLMSHILKLFLKIIHSRI